MTVLARLRKKRNVRGVLLALKVTFVGKDAWDKIIKDSENLLQNRKWIGTTNTTLERHTAGNQEIYTFITKATEHVHHQILPEQTYCTKLIRSFDCNYTKMLSGLEAVENDDPGVRGLFLSMRCIPYSNRPSGKKESEGWFQENDWWSNCCGIFWYQVGDGKGGVMGETFLA